ncbi:hypothetical protein [Haloarcula salinisoli]|uniref:Uncharacterized protein n=1 Tax=Haloarcula salinisoli TaxID=2487746 RepID=A0A8J7YCU2_9EURY|nr:hypothetical protein [Halomicroarcula salinisoli]MBX0303720.1 hypothetical protein [Halomicroarcula salinisoli]
MVKVPEPPTGVDDLHAQPKVASDQGLQALKTTLEDSLSEDVFDRLTKFVDNPPKEPSDEYRERALAYVSDCIEHRKAIRPDSLRSLESLPDQIQRITNGGWVYYRNGNQDVDHDVPESEADESDHGKYLFFAPEDARRLENIVVEQFQRRPFRAAKLPTKPAKQEDWVLCLYQGDNRYWYELREEYRDPPTVRFRGFKTDNATRRGEYSDRFREVTENT